MDGLATSVLIVFEELCVHMKVCTLNKSLLVLKVTLQLCSSASVQRGYPLESAKKTITF